MAVNKRIPELPLRNNPSTSMRIPAWNPSDDVTYGIILSSIITSNENSVPIWQSGIVYPENFVVLSDDQLWISQQDDNQGVLPGTDESFWLAENQSKPWTLWSSGIYTANPTFVFKQLGDTIELFLLNPSISVPYISSDFESELQDGSWIQVTNYIEIKDFDVDSDVVIDFENKAKINHVAVNPINEAKTWVFENYSLLKESKVKFIIENPEDIQTLPPGVRVLTNAGDFDSSTGEWVPYDSGYYEFIISSDGMNLSIKIEGPYSDVVSS